MNTVLFWVLIILASLIVFYIISCIFIPYFLFRKKEDKYHYQVNLKGTAYEPYTDLISAQQKKMLSLKYDEVYVKSYDGLKLGGYLYHCSKKTDKVAVLFHGYRSKPLNNFPFVGEFFLNNDYDVLMISQRGHGLSEGNFTYLGGKEYKDVPSWVQYASSHYQKIILYGTSMGAYALGAASSLIHDEKVKTLVLDCGFTSLSDQIKYIIHLNNSFCMMWYPGIVLFSKLLYGVDVHLSASDSLKQCHIPCFFIHGKKDRNVPYQDSLKNYQLCGSMKKQIYLCDNASHTTSFMIDYDKIQSELLTFINNCED